MEELTFYNVPQVIVLGIKQGYCNLACPYCYIPHSKNILTMQPEVVLRVAEYINGQDRRFKILLHGGEPMLGSVEETKQLLAPLLDVWNQGKITFHIQTNGVLIDQEWCDFFKKYKFGIGVSLDGPEWANKMRIDHSGAPAYDRIIRGIRLLHENEIEFHIISVINKIGLDRPEELYEFFKDVIRPHSWCINLEEIEGVNSGSDYYNDDYEDAYRFWNRLFNRWYQDSPEDRMRVRELAYVNSYIDRVLKEEGNQTTYYMYTTLSYKGDVYVHDPELAGLTAPEYDNFVVGNVLNSPLAEILSNVENFRYVREFREGVKNCQAQCSFFDFCQSRSVLSNKFSEGKINGTETRHCRMTKKALLSATLAGIRSQSSTQATKVELGE